MSRVFLRTLAAAMLTGMVCSAGVNAEVPAAEFLAAGLCKQETSLTNALEVDYTCEWKSSENGVPTDRLVRQFKYVRTPEVLRIERFDPGGRTVTCSYDRVDPQFRSLNTKGSESLGWSGTKLGSLFGNRELLETSRYPLFEGPLCERIEFGTVREQMEEVDGHDCWCIDVPTEYTTLEKYVVWVDPDVGFNPRRIKYVWKHEQPTVITFKDYAQHGTGFWFPNQQHLEYFWTSKNLAYTQVNTVTRISTARSIPKDELIVEFPSGTVLRTPGGGKVTVP